MLYSTPALPESWAARQRLQSHPHLLSRLDAVYRARAWRPSGQAMALEGSVESTVAQPPAVRCRPACCRVQRPAWGCTWQPAWGCRHLPAWGCTPGLAPLHHTWGSEPVMAPQASKACRGAMSAAHLQGWWVCRRGWTGCTRGRTGSTRASWGCTLGWRRLHSSTELTRSSHAEKGRGAQLQLLQGALRWGQPASIDTKGGGGLHLLPCPVALLGWWGCTLQHAHPSQCLRKQTGASLSHS